MDLESVKGIVGLFVPFVTPAIIAIVGYYVSQRLKHIDESLWVNRKVTEERLRVIQIISPKVNEIYCFFRWVGDWKSVSPENLVKTKRELDKFVHVNRYLLSHSFMEEYMRFMNALFWTYAGYGTDFKILSEIAGKHGNRAEHCSYEWQGEYELMFEESGIASDMFLDELYERINEEFKSMIGLPTK